MALVSTREWEGYTLSALWEHGLDETPTFDVQVTAPDGQDVGEWVVRGCGLSDETTLDFAQGKAFEHWDTPVDSPEGE